MKILPLYFLIVHIATRFCRTSRVEGDLFCSSFCVCDMWYRLRRATCTSKHLFSIETGVSNTVQALDLSNNSIVTLLNYELKNTGLVSLKYLNLSDNSINEIGSFAFTDLVELTVLDLSRNHLYYVLWDTFVDSKNLRILHLDGNRFGTRIPDLHSSSITELGLSNCQISHVTTRAFAGLQQLRKLDLSGNFMIQIDFREFEPLSYLRDVNFDRNPWSCGGTKQLQSYLEKRRISFNPFCAPSTVRPLETNNKVKMFEKMIDGGKILGDNAETDFPNGPKTTWIIADPPSAPIDNKKSCESDPSVDEAVGLLPLLATISPLWIFAVGFTLGAVTSMLGTYVWVTGSFCTCTCPCPRIPRRDGRSRIINDNTSQRISLLSPITCPGTPPPPYRDAMLHSSSYPTPSS